MLELNTVLYLLPRHLCFSARNDPTELVPPAVCCGGPSPSPWLYMERVCVCVVTALSSHSGHVLLALSTASRDRKLGRVGTYDQSGLTG